MPRKQGARNEEVDLSGEVMLDPLTLSMIGLKGWQSKIESKITLGTASDEEVEYLHRIATELRRREQENKQSQPSSESRNINNGEKRGTHAMTMFDPSAIGGLGDAQEPKAVDAGEYKLSILSVRTGVTAEAKGAKTYWQPMLEIVGQEDSKDFTHFLFIPDSQKMQPKELARARWHLQEFMDTFGLDYSRPFTPAEDWPGAEGWALLRKQTVEGYGEQNQIDKLIKPQ